MQERQVVHDKRGFVEELAPRVQVAGGEYDVTVNKVVNHARDNRFEAQH